MQKDPPSKATANGQETTRNHSMRAARPPSMSRSAAAAPLCQPQPPPTAATPPWPPLPSTANHGHQPHPTARSHRRPPASATRPAASHQKALPHTAAAAAGCYHCLRPMLPLPASRCRPLASASAAPPSQAPPPLPTSRHRHPPLAAAVPGDLTPQPSACHPHRRQPYPSGARHCQDSGGGGGVRPAPQRRRRPRRRRRGRWPQRIAHALPCVAVRHTSRPAKSGQ